MSDNIPEGPHLANDNPWGSPPRKPGNKHGGKRRPGASGSDGPDLDALFRKSQDHFHKMFKDGNNGGSGKGLILAFFAILLVWFASGIYIVDTGEQGVVTRFGKYHRTTAPGLNYHLPYPAEEVFTPKVEEVKREEIGFRSGYGSRAGNESMDNTIPKESLMLTGDENIVKIHFEAQWRIKDAPDFLFNIRNPSETVKDVAESAMREVIGKTKIATVLAQGKAEVEAQTRDLMQRILDDYEAGIVILSVNLQDVDPPNQVIDAFRDVQSARADAESAINRAEAYKNDIIPRARGQAAQITAEAEGYKQEVVNRAKGEAARFSSVYSEYKQAKDVTKKRLYLEMIEETLAGMNKVIVNQSGGQGVLPYLPLPELRKGTQGKGNQ